MAAAPVRPQIKPPASTTRPAQAPAPSKPAAAPPARRTAPAAAKPPAQPPVRTGAKNARAYDFGDETVKGGFTKRPEAFKGKAGMTYVLRIVTFPVAYFGSYIENKSDPSKSFFLPSRANYDDAKAAFDGDDDAAARASQDCPLFARGYKIQMKFVCGVYVAGRIDGKGRFEKSGTFHPWSFGGERYQNLTNLARVLPFKADGKTRVSMRSVEIMAACTDDKYQKFNLAAVTSKSDIKVPWAEVWDSVKQFFDGDTPDSKCDKIEEFIEPESKRDMIADLDRVDGNGAGQVEEPDDAPAPKPAARTAKPAGRASKPAPAADPEETGDDADTAAAIDAALGGLEGDEPPAEGDEAPSEGDGDGEPGGDGLELDGPD